MVVQMKITFRKARALVFLVLRGELVPLPMVRQMLGSRTELLATGSGPGGEGVSLVDLETGISVVVLSNTSGLEQQIALERARGLLAAVFASDKSFSLQKEEF